MEIKGWLFLRSRVHLSFQRAPPAQQTWRNPRPGPSSGAPWTRSWGPSGGPSGRRSLTGTGPTPPPSSWPPYRASYPPAPGRWSSPWPGERGSWPGSPGCSESRCEDDPIKSRGRKTWGQRALITKLTCKISRSQTLFDFRSEPWPFDSFVIGQWGLAEANPAIWLVSCHVTRTSCSEYSDNEEDQLEKNDRAFNSWQRGLLTSSWMWWELPSHCPKSFIWGCRKFRYPESLKHNVLFTVNDDGIPGSSDKDPKRSPKPDFSPSSLVVMSSWDLETLGMGTCWEANSSELTEHSSGFSSSLE